MSPSRTSRLIAAIAGTALGVGGLLALGPAPVAGAAPTAPAEAPRAVACTLAPPSDPRDHAPAGCVAARLDLDRVPALGQTATATLRLASEVRIPRARVTVRTPAGLTVVSGGFSAGERRGLDSESNRTLDLGPDGRTLTFQVRADATGPAQLDVEVSDPDSPLAERTAHATTEITVGRTAASSGFGVSGTRSTAHREDGRVQTGRVAGTQRSTVDGGGRTTAATPGRICAAGSLTVADHAGTWRSVGRASVAVVGQTNADAAPTTLASGLTGTADGGYSLCFTAPAGQLATMWVQFTSANAWWQVTDLQENPYVVSTAPLSNVASGTTQQYGVASPSALHMPAFDAFDIHNGLYDVRGSGTPCWTAAEDEDCSRLQARWAPGNTDGGYYSLEERAVYLTDAMPDAQHPVVHEAGHNLQHLLYNWAWPTFDCPSPHYLHRASGPMCGWTEGFANALTGYVMGDGRYYYNTVDFMDLMQTGWQDPTVAPARTNPDNGSHTEARVAGAMIRLWREIDGGPQRTLRNMDEQFSGSFEEWFLVDRPKAKLSIGAPARALLHEHTIDYRTGKQSEALANGGLEDQGEGWTITGGVVGTWTTYRPSEGRAYAWMGGNGAVNTDTLSQQLRIPAAGETVLSFDLQVHSTEATSVKADRLRVQIIADGVTHTYGTWWNGDVADAYAHRVIDLSAFAGQRVTLKLVSTEDDGEQTDFVVDNLSVSTKR